MLANHFTRFFEPDPRRLHFCAHSHHPWPDATQAAHAQDWTDSSTLVDRKWDRVFGEVVPKAQAPAEEGFGLVLANKYYVDEIYDAAVVNPTVQISRNVLWRGIDAGLIDGLLVNGSSALARAFGWVGSRLQTGTVGTYAWVLVAGVLVVLGAVTLR